MRTFENRRTYEEMSIYEEMTIRISNIETKDDWNATATILALLVQEGGLSEQDGEVFGSILAKIADNNALDA